MKPPGFDAVPPEELDAVVDKLLSDSGQIAQWARLSGPFSGWDLSYAARWQEILVQAKAREIERAPRARDYGLGIGGGFLAILGFGLVTAPVGVPAAIALAVGLGGGVISLAGAGWVISGDARAMARLQAIEQASLVISEKLDLYRRSNLPS